MFISLSKFQVVDPLATCFFPVVIRQRNSFCFEHYQLYYKSTSALSYRVSINAISVVSRWGQGPVGPAQVQVQRRREGRGGRGRRFGGGKRVGPEVIEGRLEGAVGRVATPPVAGRSDAGHRPHCENNCEAFQVEEKRKQQKSSILVCIIGFQKQIREHLETFDV